MTIEELREKAFKLRGRKQTVSYEGLKFEVHEPSYKVTRALASLDEEEAAVFLLRQCVTKPGSDQKLFLDCDDGELNGLPMGLVSSLAKAAVSFLKDESVEVAQGN